jgi:hypothetical protein
MIEASLFPKGVRRLELNKGSVCAVAPPEWNPRLASQQGVFLLNCAEKLIFEDSLRKMMGDQEGWLKTVDIEHAAASEIEERLFQMNIHEQALFPDLEGLAGLIRQKLRLHWR